MRSAKRGALIALSLSVAAVGLAACGGDDGGSGDGPGGGGDFVDGGAFTMALANDPGALDPHSGVASGLLQASRFAYDSLVGIDAEGQVVSQLASSWDVEGTTATMEIQDGITCSDGSDFTAETAAANLSYVGDPKNKSPFLGVFMPVGAKASAEGSTVTLELAGPTPFLFEGLANLPMVCQSGLDDRDSLKDATAGTGPFVLEEVVPGDSYTYTVREGYTWGPDGASTDEAGTPATVTLRIIANETTAANEVLSGTLNAAQVIGADAERLEGADLFHTETPAINGEQWHNHAEGHVTSDPAVRTALTQAVDLEELQNVITSGTGEAPTQLAVVPPTGCQGGSTDALPDHDPDAAAAALDEAGWVAGDGGVREKDGEPLAVTFLYDATLGAGGRAAAELATEAWTELGVEVEAQELPQAQMQEIMFGTGEWDVVWEPININTPDQLVPFLSGPGIADGGTNFAAIDNADYQAAVDTAMTKQGAEGCDDWMAAEEALFTTADVVPFANNLFKIFGNKAEFTVTGSVDPTSIRMLG
jgi:peptide/nickel transport system substrate-binding protein